MENNAAQPGKPVDPNDALARLQQLEEEAKRLREQLQREATPAAAQPSATAVPTTPAGATPAATPAAVSVPEVKPPQPTPAQREEADKLIQRYRLEKQRGNKEFAARYLAEAAQMAPGYTYVLECQGDEAAENRKHEEAKRLYKLAKSQDILNSSADAKLANLVFRAEAAPAAAHLKMNESTASAKSAGILTAFVPGLGQIVTGQTVKGIIILVCWVLLLFLVPSGVKSAGNLFGGRSGVDTVALLGLAASLFLYVIALVDMNAYSKSTAAREKFMGMAEKKERPVPPANLPFE